MNEQTQAASSTAVMEAPVELPSSGSSEYAQWRATGELPKAQPKPADPASADAPKETTTEPAKAKPAPGTEPGKSTQESRRKPGAEQRIGELTAELKQLRRELEEARKPTKTQADSSPAKASQPQTYKEWREQFKPTAWAERYVEQNKDATMAEVSAALADYMAEVRDQYRTVEQQLTQQRQSVGQKLSEARQRYQDFDTVAAPVLQEMLKPDVSREVFNILNDSPVLADLLYVIGGTEQSKQDFLEACRSQPSKALRIALLMEGDIVRELGKTKEAPRSEAGKDARTAEEQVPAKKSPENAPAPPLEIGHRGTGAMDESERALSAIERGNENAVRDWLRAENAKELRRRRGA